MANFSAKVNGKGYKFTVNTPKQYAPPDRFKGQKIVKAKTPKTSKYA